MPDLVRAGDAGSIHQPAYQDVGLWEAPNSQLSGPVPAVKPGLTTSHPCLDYLQLRGLLQMIINMGKPSDLVQGTLDLLILKTIHSSQSTVGRSLNASNIYLRKSCRFSRLALPSTAPVGAAGLDQSALG